MRCFAFSPKDWDSIAQGNALVVLHKSYKDLPCVREMFGKPFEITGVARLNLSNVGLSNDIGRTLCRNILQTLILRRNTCVEQRGRCPGKTFILFFQPEGLGQKPLGKTCVAKIELSHPFRVHIIV